MKNINDITLKYLREWGKVNTSGKVYTYVSTLMKNYPEAETWGDVLAMRLTGKKFEDLRKAVDVDSDNILGCADSMPNSVFLPFTINDNDSFEDMLGKFISDYCSVMGNKDTSPDTLKIIRLSYVDDGYNALPVPNVDIAAVVSLKSGERVRQIKVSTISRCRSILNGKSTKYMAQPPLREAFERFTGMSPQEVINITREGAALHVEKPRLKAFLHDVLYIKESKTVKGVAVEKNQSLTEVNHSLGRLKRSLTDRIVINLDEFRTILRRDKKVIADAETLLEYIKNTSTDFEIIPGENESQLVALRWEKMNNVEAQCARILFDNAERLGDRDASMTREQLMEEYDRRALCYGIKKQFKTPRHQRIQSVGAGNYKFNYSSRPKQKLGSLASVIASFISSNPDATKEQTISYCQSLNLQHTESSIYQTYCRVRSQFSAVTGKSPRKMENTEERRKNLISILEEAGRPMTAGEISQIYNSRFCEDDHQVSASSLYNSIMGATNLFAYDKDTKLISLREGLQTEGMDLSRKKRYNASNIIIARAIELLLDAPGHSLPKRTVFEGVCRLWNNASVNNVYHYLGSDPKHLIESVGKGRGTFYRLNEENYRKEHEGEYVNMLTDKVKRSEVPYSWDSLKDALANYLSDLNVDNLHGAIDRMKDIMGRYKPLSAEFHKTLVLSHMVLYKYSTAMEKEYLHYKLTFGLEQYLKNYAEYYCKSHGLGTLINDLQDKGYLPGRFDVAKTSIDGQIQDITGLMITGRNVIAHQNRIVSDLKDIFSFYVLVAAYE